MKDGRIEPDAEAALPEGARVVVELEAKQAAANSKVFLGDFVGCMGNDLPVDLAEQHDHFIHGTPKR